MISGNSEPEQSPASPVTTQTPRKSFAYFAAAGLVLVNVGLFGISLLMALFSIMGFDAPDAWQQPGAKTSFLLFFTMPVSLGAAVFGAIRFHEKGRFGAVVVVTLFAFVCFVLPFVLLFILQR